jgi:hypothetical protein
VGFQINLPSSVRPTLLLGLFMPKIPVREKEVVRLLLSYNEKHNVSNKGIKK